ncbi:hypothetical protein HPB50_024168 [Hyalomma asiaticum]|uniref:Uncharacterized protein n=1 Tax=Hyalomma asiaticum TaxID=266040 RepID=A0ACB7SHQ1_HYAAI|nr:hypothetical protein HPB50_024168 [Hyalomma asiaticum]
MTLMPLSSVDYSRLHTTIPWREFEFSCEPSSAGGITTAAQEPDPRTDANDASIVVTTKGADATVESKGDTTRKKHRRRSKASEPGSQRRKAKKRIGDNRRSLTSSGSSKLEEHTSAPLSAYDDARTTGTSSGSPPKPSVDVVSASGLSQETFKPPEPAAHLGVIPSTSALPLPTFAERSDVLTDGRGAETLPGCRKHGYSLALTRNLNVSPCYDFYEYACGKWNRLYRLPILDEMRIQAQIITYNELKAVTLFTAWKRSLGLFWPEQRQTATAHPLDVLLRLALRWNVSPLFTVRISADRRRPGRTFFFGAGTLNERERRERHGNRPEIFERTVRHHCRSVAVIS